MKIDDFSERNTLYEKVFFEGFSLDSGRIFQIAECSVAPGGEIPEHKQRCDELTYVVSELEELIYFSTKKKKDCGL